MTEPKSNNSHNNLFIETLSRPQEARSLIENYFPEEVVRVLDLETLIAEKDSFVDPQLRESFCDLLYSVQLRSSAGAAQSANVYLLFEHKSVPDRLTAFQMLRYVVRIWERQLQQREQLVPVFPFLLYHGESPWNAPSSIEDLIPTPEALAPYCVRFKIPVIDLQRLPNEELRGSRFVQSLLYVLKYGRSVRLREYLEQIIACMRDPETNLPDWARLETVLIYIMSTNRYLSTDEVIGSVKSVFPSYEPGSIFDRLYNEGREEGRVEGLEKGEILGQIRAMQRLLGEKVSSLDELTRMSKAELTELLQSIEGRIDRKN